MKVLLLPDRLNWAYHSIAKALLKYNEDTDLVLDIHPVKGNIDKIKRIYKKYDLYFPMGWQTFEKLKFLPLKQTITGIHSHHSWDNRKTSPEKDVKPPRKLIDFLNGFKRVNAVSYRLYKLFQTHGVSNIAYTANGVDTELFQVKKPLASLDFIVGYSGTQSHDWRKGISEFILPAAERAGVKTKLAMANTDSHLTLEKMPQFYRQLDCYVCASLSEGMSLSVLEAAVTGLPIISTRVGGCTEIIKDGENGFLVDRSVDKIAEKIYQLKSDSELYKRISINIAETIRCMYDWKIRAIAWYNFIQGIA